MKNPAKHMLKSGVSLMLVLCMILSMMPLSVLASDSTAEPATTGVADVNNDGVITYVSFGDSVTNGYGMDGYRFADGTNVLGFRQEVDAAYPALIRDYLTSQGHTVNLEQMAISGFRMDELHWMLDDDYVGDSYHNHQFDTWNQSAIQRMLYSEDPECKEAGDELFTKYESTYGTREAMVEHADEIIMNEYRTAVANADLITIDLGTNNFGTFLTNTIQELLGLTELDYEIDFSQYLDEKTAASLEAVLSQLIAGMVGGTEGQAYDLALTLARCLMFGYLGYTNHYDGAIAAIQGLNPDAKVVVIDCYTMITGVELEGGALGSNLDLDMLYDMFIDMANFYARELSPYASVVTHATLDSAPALFIDAYADYETNKANGTYADTQYLHPSAERLMNEFIMENMGYDADDPEDREAFQTEILDSLELLDGYVSNIKATVETEVIGLIVDGVQTAADAVDTAINGIELIDMAVEYTDLAQQVVDMIVSYVIDGEYADMFQGSSTSSLVKSIAIDLIIDELDAREDLMLQIGMEPTDENKEMLAEEIYYVACIYYDEMHRDGGSRESANRLAVIEILRFALVTVNGTEEAEAQATAELAYDVATLFNATIANGGSEKDAYIACLMEAGDVDQATAELAYALYFDVYSATIANGASEADARKTAIITAIAQSDEKYAGEGVAQALYNVYAAATDGNASTMPTEANLITALATEGIDEATAKAIYACYTQNLDGKYDNANVQTTMIFLMVMGLGMTQEAAADNYNSYLTYKRMPTTLSKIAKIDTIYFDALLSGTPDLGAVAEKFMAGTLALDKPTVSETADPEAWAAYKSDSALATLYFRFMTQDGVYTHPSEAGQQTLFNAAEEVLDSLLDAEADREITLDEDSSVVILGDFVAATEGSYVELLKDALGEDQVTDLSSADFRINDVRALLDSSYAGDDYTDAVTGGVSASAVEDTVEDSDVVIVNLGSMNLGMIAKQLEKYLADGSTYSMKFSTVDSMDIQGLGTTIDGLLSGFENAFDQSTGAMMLAFETYGYGYTTFADCLANTIETIQDLNPDADIVLVGMYDLLGQAYIDNGQGLYLEMGAFVGHAVNLMNQHMENYAMMTDNVTYLDVSDVETISGDNKVNMLVEGLDKAFDNALPTEESYETMTQRLLCHMGKHAHDADDIRWTWSDDRTTAVASYTCADCGTMVSVVASGSITSTTTATCTEDGEITYTATVVIDGESLTNSVTDEADALGHDYDEDGVCTRCGDVQETEPSETTEPQPTEPEPTEPDPTEPDPTEPDPTEPDPTEPEPTEPEPTEPEPTEPHEHSFGEWYIVKDPSSKVAGLEERKCECGAVEQRVINKLTNPFQDVKSTNYYYEQVLWAVYRGITAGTSETTFGPRNPCTRAQIVTFLWRAVGSPEPESTKNPFTDVKKTDYFYKAVLWAVENGVTAGVSSTKFGPGVVCTRGQVVTFLWRAKGSPEPESTKNPFTDVKKADYFYDSVLWAVENGITAGISDTAFGPSNTCIRGQIVTFLYKAYVIK